MKYRTTIGFEGLAPENAPETVPTGYAGLDWFNFGVVDEDRYQKRASDSGFADARGEGTGFNKFEELASFGADENDTFNLREAWFAAGWNDDLQVTVTGWRDGVRIAVKQFVVGTERELVKFGRPFNDIDHVEITTSGGRDVVQGGQGTQVSIDDIVLASNDIVW